MTTPKYPDIEVNLSGISANAFAVIAACQRVARKAGVSQEELAAFRTEGSSGDYDNVLQTCMKWFEVEFEVNA